MTPILITGDSVAASTNAFANDVNTTSGLAFTLAATTVSDGLAHKVIVTPSKSVTGNYTITGTNGNDEPQSETLATSTTNAVTSAKYYKSLVSVLAPSGITDATVDIGYTAASASPWEFINDVWTTPGMGFGCTVDSGTPTYGVEQQYGDGTAFTHSTVTGETTSQEGSYTYPVRDIRLIWSAAGEVTLRAWY